MSWDIYGNPLRRGHCDVHPHVHEEYPCSVCMAERNYNQQQPSYEIERLNYELDQQNDYIKELKSERDALAAQVGLLQRKVFETYNFQSNTYTDDSNGALKAFELVCDCFELAKLTPQQCLAEIKAEAVLKFAGTILVKYRYDITEWAKEYADKIRQGGE